MVKKSVIEKEDIIKYKPKKYFGFDKSYFIIGENQWRIMV